ncbi:MAG: hypothetical protein GX299_09330 [Epulopiscium sp.]|jgi:hypothetical protein|nr:hypothetical protein [Candidatus Epulonipiscium sp.]
MKFNWKTEKGNQVELIVKETILDKTADGTKYGEEIFKAVGSFKANGKEYNAQFMTDKGRDVIVFYLNNKEMTVIIPQEIVSKIWPERKAQAEAFDKSLKMDQEYEAHYNKVLKTMGRD